MEVVVYDFFGRRYAGDRKVFYALALRDPRSVALKG
jgi:hypothetical protein